MIPIRPYQTLCSGMLFSLFMAVAPAAAHGQTVDAQWDTVLADVVQPPDESGLARVDYAAFQTSPEKYKALTAFITAQEARNPDDLNEAEALSYWANLYNAVTVKLIVDNYPVSSIRKIKSGLFSSGPWGRDVVTVNGEDLSLDNIEHDIMRETYPSPMIHYMVNCASVGCPNLKNGLWRAQTLTKDQEQAARDYINSPRGAQVTADGLDVSKIYDWYEEDFGGSKQGVLDHIAQYAEDDLAAALDAGTKIDNYHYNWSLNVAR